MPNCTLIHGTWLVTGQIVDRRTASPATCSTHHYLRRAVSDKTVATRIMSGHGQVWGVAVQWSFLGDWLWVDPHSRLAALPVGNVYPRARSCGHPACLLKTAQGGPWRSSGDQYLHRVSCHLSVSVMERQRLWHTGYFKPGDGRRRSCGIMLKSTVVIQWENVMPVTSCYT